MTATRGRDLRAWFEAACDLPEGEWATFLSEGCEDAGLADEVLDLLRRDRHGDLPLAAPALATGPRELLSGLAHEPDQPEAIGDYQVVGVLGRGAMGTVYEATQPGTGARVAVKVLRSGLPSAALLHRFRREAAALARLDHPAIAAILESGTAEVGVTSLPFIAMELVTGRPLDQYCQDEGLDVRARLELLLAVAEGVEHAHQRGVIHRDLKPGNVLVDGRGQPRLLDFGVARTAASDSRTASLHTATGQLVGTLSYMSPEQTLGDPSAVDGRCDVYALGVMGYEVLAGHLPYDVSRCPLSEALRRIAHEDPPPLANVREELRGDLSVVFTRALEKDPDQRYPDMAAFADDLRSALAARPIRARAPGWSDQLAKLSRRNPRLVKAAAAFVVLLALGAGGTTWGWLTALGNQAEVEVLLAEQTVHTLRAESATAEMGTALAESEAVLVFLEDLFGSLHPDELGRQVRLEDVLALASPRLAHTFADQPRVAARLNHTLGVAWQSVGDYGRALEHLDEAVRLISDLDGDHDDLLVKARLNRGMVRMDLGQQDVAVAELTSLEQLLSGLDRVRQVRATKVLARAHQLAGNPAAAGDVIAEILDASGHVPGVPVDLDEEVRIEQGQVLAQQGDLDGARALLASVMEARAARLGPGHMHTVDAAGRLAEVLVRAGEFAEAEPLLLTRVQVLGDLLGAEHPRTLHARGRLAFLLVEANRGAECLNELDDLVATSRRVLGPRHPRTANLLVTLSVAADQGGRSDAAALTDEAVVLGREVLGNDHPHMVPVLSNAGIMRYQQGRKEEAVTLLQEALALYDRVPGAPVTDRVLVMVNLAGMLMVTDRMAEAEAIIREGLPLAKEVLGERHPQTISLGTYLGDVCLYSGQWDEAERAYMAIIDLGLETTHQNMLTSLAGLGNVFAHTGRGDQAGPLLDATLETALTVYPEGHPLILMCRAGLAAVDDPAEAP
jgi:tetratricopeptide (TPR) repeat protein/predicted Ser/Thr protein kinase